MLIYVPVHTSCSTCGTVSGDNALGVAFRTEGEALDYLRGRPNTRNLWGESESVRVLELSSAAEEAAEQTEAEAAHLYGADHPCLVPLCGHCGECEACGYGQF